VCFVVQASGEIHLIEIASSEARPLSLRGACDKTHVPTEFWQPTVLALCPAIFTASL
jgi:hypothetical protein